MFTHIAIHTPKPEYRDDVIASMQRAGAASDGAEGLLQMGPWQEIDGGRLVGPTSDPAHRAVKPRGHVSSGPPPSLLTVPNVGSATRSITM